jgi:CubicO group peptidase (beta-lactamase class C family)
MAFFNAVLRDYARLGRLLAHDGAWEGKQIIPAQWLIEATTVRTADAYLAPGKAHPTLGYGYLLWLLPGARRQFALVGANGQRICVDPTWSWSRRPSKIPTRFGACGLHWSSNSAS